MKYLIATLLLFVGVGFIVTAGVMKQKVGEGRSQIAEARQNVDTVERLSNLSKYTAPAGKVVAKQAGKHIDAGEQKADRYQSMSNWFMVIGICLVILSTMLFIFFWKNS